jgi:hypothetical protein
MLRQVNECNEPIAAIFARFDMADLCRGQLSAIIDYGGNACGTEMVVGHKASSEKHRQYANWFLRSLYGTVRQRGGTCVLE